MNNREIKFRVWDNKYKNWMQCGFSFNGVGDFISRGGRGFSLDYILKNETLTDKVDGEIPFNGSNPRWVVQQYTGLKDKNGKEIYDGDIVKVWSDHYTNRVREFDLAVVIWEWDKWALRVSNENSIKRYNRPFPVDEEYVEIIGNILEHPHMVRI